MIPTECHDLVVNFSGADIHEIDASVIADEMTEAQNDQSAGYGLPILQCSKVTVRRKIGVGLLTEDTDERDAQDSSFTGSQCYRNELSTHSLLMDDDFEVSGSGKENEKPTATSASSTAGRHAL